MDNQPKNGSLISTSTVESEDTSGMTSDEKASWDDDRANENYGGSRNVKIC